jgi:hypothetical protein
MGMLCGCGHGVTRLLPGAHRGPADPEWAKPFKVQPSQSEHRISNRVALSWI